MIKVWPGVFAMFASLSMSTQLLASEQFGKLECKATLNDKLQVQVDDNISLTWKTNSTSAFKLLRATAPKQIPDGLLKQYNVVEVEVKLPTQDCEFQDKVLALFSCKAGSAIDVVINAKTDAYDDEAPDTYEGRLEQFAVTSGYSRDGSRNYFVLTMNGVVLNQDRVATKFAAKTSKFDAFYATVDGIPQNPECKVDGAYIVK